MIVGYLDIIAAVLFGTAFVIALYAVTFARSRVMISPMVYTASAMAVMTYVSIGNALNGLGVTSVLESREEFVEVLFLPLLAYMLYGIHMRSQAALAEKHRDAAGRLGERLNDSLAQLGEQRLGMLQALSMAVDARDHYTAQHSMHVADYSCAIALRLGMRDRLTVFEQAGLLHDVGKIGVPDTLLLKPSHLTPEEYEHIKSHVETSSAIIRSVPFLAEVVPAVRHHHERWDGSGYPDGLEGDHIPMAARILAVSDAFDAMTTDRPYRPAMSTAEARRRLLDGAGKQFDPQMVDALVALIDAGIIAIEKPTAAVA